MMRRLLMAFCLVFGSAAVSALDTEITVLALTTGGADSDFVDDNIMFVPQTIDASPEPIPLHAHTHPRVRRPSELRGQLDQPLGALCEYRKPVPVGPGHDRV